MSYFGDCRDVHYAESEAYGKGNCCHAAHNPAYCSWGKKRCNGKANCIRQVHRKFPEVWGKVCPHFPEVR